MPVTFFDGLEHLLAEAHRRLSLTLGEDQGDPCFMAPAAVGAVPGEGVDHPFRRDDLEKNAALPEFFTVVVTPQAQAPSAVWLPLAFQIGGGETARAHPAPRVCRVGPGLPDQFTRRV